MVSTHMCQALVDTGSTASLVAHRFVQSLGLRIDMNHKLPQLMGITDHTVPMLGTVYLKVFVGQQHLNYMFFVVPDNLVRSRHDRIIPLFLGCSSPDHYLEWNHLSGKNAPT